MGSGSSRSKENLNKLDREDDKFTSPLPVPSTKPALTSATSSALISTPKTTFEEKSYRLISGECPLADLKVRAILRPEDKRILLVGDGSTKLLKCPFHHHKLPQDAPQLTSPIMLNIVNKKHKESETTAQLLKDIGGGDIIREFCTRFYSRAFIDKILKDFFFEDDGATRHGKRLADWIIEKMGGEGEPWTDSGRYGMREPAHHAAWNSHKRSTEVTGQRFKLDDTRAWMRLHFWAAREYKLHENKVFWDWYIKFISHFIAVYESTAPPYTVEDSEWSANPENIQRYIEDEYLMTDIAGIGRYETTPEILKMCDLCV